MRALILLVLVGCNGPTAPSDVPDDWTDIVKLEWAIAVKELVAAGVPEWRIEPLQWHDFLWRRKPGPFVCGAEAAATGCYTADWHLIEWSALHPTALRHEIKHGILHKLGYACWRVVEHGPGTCPEGGE